MNRFRRIATFSEISGPILALWLAAPGAAIGGEEGTGIRGDLLYHNYCSVCHGDHGDGRSRARFSLVPPPRDFTSARDLTSEYMIGVVTNGKPGTAMVGWKTQLGEKEISAVVDFVRTSFMSGTANLPVPIPGVSGIQAHGGRERDARPMPVPVKVDMDLGMPFSLQGDLLKGESFYMGNCATCHGSKGDGNGPRAYFINPKPRNFLEMTPRSYLNRPALYAAISMGRVGTEMPAWGKVLSQQEISNVTEFVFQRFTAPGKQAAEPPR